VPGGLRKTTETSLRAEIRAWCPRVTCRMITKLNALSTPSRQSTFLFFTTYRKTLRAVHYRIQWIRGVKRPDHQAKHLHILPRMRVCGDVPPWHVEGRLNLYDPWPTTSVLGCSIYVLDSGFAWLMSLTLIRSRCECVARSKTWVYGHSLAGITGSNPVVVMDVCLLWVLCVVR